MECFIAVLVANRSGWNQAPRNCHVDFDELFHFVLSQFHFASTHASAATIGFCKNGASCAISNRPRGSIQSPKIGKKLKMPPKMNNKATMTRIAKEDGCRSQRINREM